MKSKYSRKWFYEVYEICISNPGLSVKELNRLKGIALDVLFRDHYFEKAEKLAKEIMESHELPQHVYMTLTDFYTKTRRYDKADEILAEAEKLFADDENALPNIRKFTRNNAEHRSRISNGRLEFVPAPRNNKVRQKYLDFLRMIGIISDNGRKRRICKLC